ncbi:MAG: integrase arm-type DNA-binding domain-containing protein [Thalassovita sp.]
MARNKLKAIEVKNGAGKLFDGGGLYLIKRETNSGRWTYRFKIAGKSREMGLGSYPSTSLAEARKSRDEWEKVLKSGQDPIETRKRHEEEKRSASSRSNPTFAEAVSITFEAKKGGLKDDGAAGRWMSPLELYVIPKLGDRKIAEIHQSDIHSALSPIWRLKPPTAEKAIQRTKIVFVHMRMSGVDCDPMLVDMARHMLGEVHHVPEKLPAARWQDIPEIFSALSRDDPSHLCLRLKILTAVRSASVRGARFDEIDNDVWTIPADRMKGRRGAVTDFRVPLSTSALEVIKRAENWRRGPCMFPGQGAKGPSTGVSDVAIAKVLKKIAPGTTPHGFRTSFRSWVQDVDPTNFEVAETALAHTVGNKVERSYARSDLLERRRILMQAWADYVTGSASNVVNINNKKSRSQN